MKLPFRQISASLKQLSRLLVYIYMLCNFIEITLRHGFFRVHLLNILRPPFPKNIYGGLLL